MNIVIIITIFHILALSPKVCFKEYPFLSNTVKSFLLIGTLLRNSYKSKSRKKIHDLYVHFDNCSTTLKNRVKLKKFKYFHKKKKKKSENKK